MAVSARFWHIGIIHRTLKICGFLYAQMCFLFDRLLWISFMTDLACYSFKSMQRVRPLLIICCRKLSQPVLMAFERACNILLKMLDSYLVELLLNILKR